MRSLIADAAYSADRRGERRGGVEGVERLGGLGRVDGGEPAASGDTVRESLRTEVALAGSGEEHGGQTPTCATFRSRTISPDHAGVGPLRHSDVMAFQATTLQMLISCPGDIEQEDLAAARKAITRWNVLHGEAMEHTVIPVHWSEHASAEFGEPAQTVINRQLVHTVDVGIALFWGRLGTPTATAESGTAEEIVTLHDAGKPVSVLRCTKPIAARGDHAERARLDDYLREEIQPRGLVVDYPTAAALEQQVDTILMRLVRTYDRTVSGPVASSRPSTASR